MAVQMREIGERDLVRMEGTNQTFFVIRNLGAEMLCVSSNSAIPVRLDTAKLKRVGKASGAALGRFYDLQRSADKILKAREKIAMILGLYYDNNDDGNDDVTNAADLLADLMHFCGANWEDVTKQAIVHFEAESEGRP